MGHQVNFYATPPDIDRLGALIGCLESTTVLHDRSPSAKPRVLPSLTFKDKDNEQPLLFYFLVREEDVSKVVTRHVSAQGYWAVDVLESPVVEFSSCYFDGKILRRGRVHYVDGFYGEGGAWIDKPESFRAWARNLFKVTRKALKKHGTDYIGEDALSWLMRGGGKLVT